MEISKKDRAEDDGGMIKVSPLYPNQDVLGVIGEFCFLCFHSTLHRKWSMEMIGRIFEPPIHLKQFKVYRARDVPRGLVTWAHMDAAAETKFIKGNGLDTHEEWNSGKSLWVVDLIAPWGHGRAIIGDILKSLPGTSFKTLRVRGGKQNVVEYYRKDESSKWRTRII